MENKQSEITVSICSITYNHAPYIRQCLDGMLMQKCNFRFEIIINDDCSTDGTTEILKEYEKEYPDLIHPVYHEENLYSKGQRGFFGKFVFPKAQGKYIALCEGDDYWTDPYKLQKQVDFLESHPDYSMCFHNAIEHWENGEKEDHLFVEANENRDYTGPEIYRTWIVPTASVLYRKSVVDSDLYQKVCSEKRFIFGDTPLFLTAAHFGKIRYLNYNMSLYRRHVGGTSFSSSLSSALNFANHHIAIYEYFGLEFRTVSNRNIANAYFSACQRAFLKHSLGTTIKCFILFEFYRPFFLIKRLFHL